MAWRLATSLERLRAQLDETAPGRSRNSDGSIGDTAHQARKSDHNPDGGGVVRAIDVTHDPAGGLSAEDLAECLRAARDSRVKYVIWNRRMFSSYGNSRRQAWQWGEYTGSNPHSSHIHISILPDQSADGDGADWAVRPGGTAGGPTAPTSGSAGSSEAGGETGTGGGGTAGTGSQTTVELGSLVLPRLDLRTAESTTVQVAGVKQLQALLLASGHGPGGLCGKDGRPDGAAGPGTKKALGDFQVATRTGRSDGSADYLVGAKTWQALFGG